MTKKRTFILILGAFIVVATLFVNASETIPGYGIGDYVKDFTLPNVDGNTVSLADYSDAKGFIVVFTCNTCPYANAYERRIMDLDKHYASRGFPVVAINPNDISQQPDDSMDKMRKRATDKGYTFPYLRDDNQEVAKAFGATKTPHAYVLNKEAKAKYKVEYIGAIDDSPRDAADVSERYVESVVKSLLEGAKPKVREKRAIGCTIKWKEQ